MATKKAVNTPTQTVNVDLDKKWDDLKKALGLTEKDVDRKLIARTIYYRDVLLNIAKGRFKVVCPKWWDIDFMLDLLLTRGRFFVTNTTIGVCPLNGSPYGLNVFSRQSLVTITNPVIGEFDRILYGEDANAVAVYLYDNLMYRTINDALDIYAEKLAMIDCALDVNIMNCKTPFIMNVADAKQAETAKLIYSNISKGEPAVFLRKNQALSDAEAGDAIIQRLPVKENYISDKLQELKRGIVGEYLTYIGLNNTAYEKRERLNEAEVTSNNDEIDANVEYIKENLRRCSKNVRNMFPETLFNISIKEGGSLEENKEPLYKNVHKEDNTQSASNRGN